ncbi:MAG: hypothetical protein A2156_06225 [Deltaproteobacteria bacterium RBG_16_48_10]|nr:MAG: hypothetical protein A2156_06225 [Deltaproteobacteria bacterium RBG_16_48_10]
MQVSTHPPEKAQSGHHFDMESLVGYILLTGVLLSVALLAVGFVWRWLRVGNLRFEHSIVGMNFFEFILLTLRQMNSQAFRPRLFLNMGIGVLMLTPFVRVLVSVFYFAFVGHNWKYTLFTGFVLSVLTYSLFLR